MAKMNKLFLLIFSIALFAGSFDEDLKNFDKNFLVSSKTEQLATHQKLKTIYIKSIISGDLDTKKEVLKRIVLSSNILKLDSSTYQKELEELGINAKKLSFKTNDTKKPIQKPTDTTKVSEKVVQTNSNFYITKIIKEDNKINFNIKGNIDEKSISLSTYNTKEINNKILEFDGILDAKKETFVDKNYEISIVQFNPKRIRIVARSKDEIDIKYNIDNGFNIEVLSKTQNIVNKKEEKPSVKKEEKPANTQFKKTEEIIKPSLKIEEKNQEKAETKGTNNISKVTKTNNGIKFNTSYEIENIKTINYGTNQIIEFDGVLLGGRKNYDFKNYSISILQFNPKKTRVVLYTKAQQKLFFNIDDNGVVFSTEELKSSKASFNKANLLITIDAGHGGKDTGANAFGRNEKDITLSVALKLSKALKNKGYKVFLTRNKDIYIGLRDRTKMANDKKSDLFISIHANSIADKSKTDKIYGIETYFLSPARSERSKNAAAIENKSDIEEMNYFSKQTFLNFLNREKIISSNKLAIDIQGGILSSIPKNYLKKDGGVKEAPFWVLVGALMPAVLIEIGYISHPIEGKNIADSKYQDFLVNGIVNGIENYFIKNK